MADSAYTDGKELCVCVCVCTYVHVYTDYCSEYVPVYLLYAAVVEETDDQCAEAHTDQIQSFED